MISLLPLLVQLWRDSGGTDVSIKADLGWVACLMLSPD